MPLVPTHSNADLRNLELPPRIDSKYGDLQKSEEHSEAVIRFSRDVEDILIRITGARIIGLEEQNRTYTESEKPALELIRHDGISKERFQKFARQSNRSIVDAITYVVRDGFRPFITVYFAETDSETHPVVPLVFPHGQPDGSTLPHTVQKTVYADLRHRLNIDPIALAKPYEWTMQESATAIVQTYWAGATVLLTAGLAAFGVTELAQSQLQHYREGIKAQERADEITLEQAQLTTNLELEQVMSDIQTGGNAELARATAALSEAHYLRFENTLPWENVLEGTKRAPHDQMARLDLFRQIAHFEITENRGANVSHEVIMEISDRIFEAAQDKDVKTDIFAIREYLQRAIDSL